MNRFRGKLKGMFDLLRIFQVRTPLTSLKPLLAWVLISLVIGSQAQGLGLQQPSPSATQEHDLGLALYGSGDTKAAIMQLTAAVKKNGDDWESWYYLGLARTRNADLKNARKAFEKGAKLRPDSAQLHAAWAYAMMLTGKDKDTEREAGQFQCSCFWSTTFISISGRSRGQRKGPPVG